MERIKKNPLVLLGWNLCFLVAALVCLGQGLTAQQNAHFYDTQENYRLGKQYFEWGNYLLAQQAFKQFLTDSEPFPNQQWQTEEIDAAYHVALASKLLHRDDAADLLTEFIEGHGNNRYYNSWANYHLGSLFYAKKKYKTAISCFEQIAPEDLDVDEMENQFFYQAYSYFNIKKFDQAFPLFHQTSQLKGDHYGDALYYMGYISFFRKDYDNAEKYFSQLDGVDSYAKIIPYYKTQLYFIKGDYERVKEYSVPKSEMRGLKYKNEMNYLIGQTYFLDQDFEKALPFLDEYVDKSSKVRKEDLYQLAYTQYKFKRYDEAIGNFLQLNTLQDSIGQNAMYHLADAYLQTNEKQKARIAFDDASKPDFDMVIKEVSTFNYAKLSYELGEDRIAINKLQEYINTYSSSDKVNEAKNLLGKILENTNNYDEALAIIDGISQPSSGMKRSYQKMAYLRGVELYNNNNEIGAENLFNRSLTYKMDRNFESLAYFWKGNIKYNNEDYRGAIGDMKQYLGTGAYSNNSDAASAGTANYTIGYAHFKQGDYRKAKTSFTSALSGLDSNKGNTEENARTLPDATLRLADCSFMQRDYRDAVNGYNKVIQRNWQGADYATYQKGIIDGLNGDYAKKIASLKKVGSKFNDSDYNDDALFQIGTTYGLQAKYGEAIGTYDKLLRNYPKSSYYTKSLNQMALMHYNSDNYDQAINYYDQVIKDYPNDPEAQNAIVGIKDVFISKGDSKGYFKYVDRLDNVSFSSSAQDSTRYQFAETSYENGDCAAAIQDFGDYLTEFPNGIFKIFAHYYKGECLYQNKNYAEAKGDFDYIVRNSPNFFTEKALDKSSRIAYYIDKDYAKAFDTYAKMYKLSDKKDISFEAMKGAARSAYELRDLVAMENFATLSLKNPLANKEERLEMEFYLGEVAWRANDLSKAKDKFFKVVKTNTSEKGAIARYRLAEIFFKQKLYDESRKYALRVKKETPNQEYWVVKSLILAADIDYVKKDFFQAKATLKSIQEHYNGDATILAEVDSKLAKILAEEAAKSKLAPAKSDDDLIELEENN